MLHIGTLSSASKIKPHPLNYAKLHGALQCNIVSLYVEHVVKVCNLFFKTKNMVFIGKLRLMSRYLIYAQIIAHTGTLETRNSFLKEYHGLLPDFVIYLTV